MQNKHSLIADKVLKKIIPDKKEEGKIQNAINELSAKINSAIKKFNLKAIPILVGSVAKGTYTKNPDVDIFIMFPKETKREDLEKFGLKIGEEVIKGERRYAEHPYIHGFYKNLEVDIVPCYKIENVKQKMSAVDRTPFHNEFVIKNLKKKQRNEVRLLKQFLKGIGVYGAENSIQGFSGYLCEILIIKYGSFLNLINNAKNWKIGEIIYFELSENLKENIFQKEDIEIKDEKIFVSETNESFKNLNRKIQEKENQLKNFYKNKFSEPLIFIDPVDNNRNVASALSLQNFSLFIFACKEFLNKPSLKFFFPNKAKVKSKREIFAKMKKRQTKLIGILFKTPNIIDDILFPQLRKTEISIIQICEENNFKVHKTKFFVAKEILMLFEFETFLLPKLKKHTGPPIYTENSDEFLNKWKNSKRALSSPYIEGERWYVDVERDYCKVEDLIKKQLLNLSVGSYVMKEIKKRHKILVDKQLLKKEFLEFLTEFYYEKFRWEN